MFKLSEPSPAKWLRALMLFLASLVSLVMPSAASAEPDRAPYAPYEFLIGTWEVAAENGEPFQINRFRWGGGRSYILFSGAVLAGGREQPQFEGMLMWNGVTKRLDMLLSTDLRYGLVQQQGSLSVTPDGTVVRDITGIFSEGAGRGEEAPAGPEGATMAFRQTYRRLSLDRIVTSVMRRVGETWQPTHPGSERWLMTRRAE